MTARLWLVRHGQTDWNREGRFQGHADPPLNDLGRRQAAALAESLADETFHAVYCSDLLRARQTAEPLAARLALPMAVDVRLREISHGAWDGLLPGDIQRRYACEWAERSRMPLTARPTGGETVLEVQARVEAAVSGIAAAHDGNNVLIVSHGLTLAVLSIMARRESLADVHDHIPPNAVPVVVSWPPPPRSAS